jgi:DNA-binding Lrp family transcriptional regulator
MAVKAFVLIEVAAGKSRGVVAGITALQQERKEILSVEAVTGPYDVIAVVEGPDVNAIGDLVTKNIQSVSGIRRTVTCLAMKLG